MKPNLAFLTVCLALVGGQVPAQEPPGLNVPFLGDAPAPPASGDEVVNVSHQWSANGVTPGGQLLLAVTMDIKPGWHVQSNDSIWEYAEETKFTIDDAPQGIGFGDIQWPPEKLLEVNFFEKPLDFFVDRSTIFVRVTVPDSVKPGAYPVKATLYWQACDDTVCLRPETTPLDLTLNVVGPGTATQETDPELFAQYQGATPGSNLLNIPFFGWDFSIDPSNLLLLLFIAAVGGFLLNLTPCVLPLIPIKIMGLSQAAENHSKCFLLGLVMAFGVVAFWLVMGIAVATVSWFTSTNQLFQFPWFTITVGVLIAVMGLGMCGLFAVRLPQWVYHINPKHDTLHGSFLFGIMAAILSTPCTAPAMGTAIAWAATQSPAITLSTFTAVGIGMALPYAVLSAFPKLVNKMPRTGPASELIKQVMGILILAAAMFFLGSGIAGLIVTPPDPPTLVYWWAIAGCIFAAGVWLAWRTFCITRAPVNRAVFSLMGTVFVGIAVWFAVEFTGYGPIDWTYYTPERLEAARADRKAVVLEFTAAWCANCHALEKGVLRNPRVAELLNSEHVAAIKVDITGNNKPGNELLNEVGSRTIPLLIIYDAQGQQVFYADNYTVSQLVSILEEVSVPRTAGGS